MKTAKFFLVLCFSLCAELSVNAQFQFEEHSINKRLVEATDLITVDFDGDGDDDIIGVGRFIPTFSHKGVVGLYRNENGTLVYEELYSSPNGFVQVYTANWNNDGYVDLVCVGETGIISFFESDGEGGINKIRQIDSVSPKVPVSQMVNWNNDEALDIFIMGEVPYVLISGLTAEDYEIEMLNGFLPSDEEYNVTVGDLDNNGFNDVLLIRAENPSNSLVFYQDGSEMSLESYAFNQPNIKEAHFLEVNGDGMLDLLLRTEYNMLWMEAAGGGEYEDAIEIPFIENDTHSKIYGGDFNNDGYFDLITFERESNIEMKTISYDPMSNWYVHAVTGLANAYGIENLLIKPECAFLDINDNGREDVFLNDYFLGKNFQITTNPLSFLPEMIDEGTRRSYYMYSHDLDSDGDLDFVVAEDPWNWFDSKMHFYFNPNDGTFPLPISIYSGMDATRQIEAIDLDSDDDLEIVAAGLEGVRIFENTGVQQYADPFEMVSNEKVRFLFNDVNQDQLPDCIYVKRNPGQIAYSLNQGGLVFSDPVEIGYGFQDFESLVYNDSHVSGQKEFIYILDGQLYHQFLEPGLNFTPLELISDEVFVTDFFLDDFNNDGLVDILASGSQEQVYINNELIYLFGQEDGSYSTPEFQTDLGLTALNADGADINSDGTSDVLINGGFLTLGDEIVHHSFGRENLISKLAAIDWDNDGDLDLIGNDFFSVNFFENTSGSGCNDNTACNYNPNAVVNDGSCCFGDCSCNDPLATNYSPSGDCASQCLYSVNGFVYRDNDLDQFRDPGEPGIEGIIVYEANSGVSTITNELGAYQFTNLPQLSNSIELGTIGYSSQLLPNVHQTDEWNIQSDFNFSVRPQHENDVNIQARTEPHNYACNDTTTFYLDLINPFQNQKEGYFSICLDELIPEIIGTNFPTDSIVGNCIYASFDTNDYVEQYEVQFLSPDVEFIGETLTHFSAAFVDNGIGIFSAEAQDILQGEMLCSYDPNDKNCNLVGYEEPHFIVDDSTLTYTIRFQNTGNAPADQVLLRDTLSPYLRGATIEFLTASHNMIPAYNPGSREMTFLFPNINLPDSTSNPEASQGYVQYRVKPVALLGQGTEIENTAYIFFDNNPAIITNTTLHTIYDCNNSLADFDVSGDGFCLGDDVTLTSSQPYIESYEWTVNGELLSSNNELSFTDISGEMEISLKVSNPICEATQTVVVNPDAQPTLSIENNEFEICPSAEITLIAESTGTISWGDYGTGSELIVQDPNEGVIQVVTTSPGGCTNTSEVSVTYISEDPVFSVENNILTASEAESYQWYQNGDPIDDATNSTFEIIESGSYAVELSYTNGCISISELQFVGYVGINQQEVSDFLIVPNPAESSFKITGLNAQIVQFHLVNSQGQLVLTGLAQNRQIIQLPAISTGMYFLHLEGYSKPMKLMVR